MDIFCLYQYIGINNNEINFAMFVSVYVYLEVVFLGMFIFHQAFFFSKLLFTVAVPMYSPSLCENSHIIRLTI